MHLSKRENLQKQASRFLVPMVAFLGTLTVQGQTTYYWNRNAVLTSDKDFNRAYNWTTGQDGTGAYIPSDKDDEFTNDALGSAWTFRDNDNDAGTGAYSLTTNADQLTLTGRGADLWGATNQYVAVYRGDIRGNFDVIVKIVSQTNTATHAKAGILVANDITNLGSGGYCIIATKPDGSVHFERDLSGIVGELETTTASGSGTFPVWVRLVRSGNAYGGYYKRTLTGAWTNLATSTSQSTTLGKGHVAIFMNTNNTVSTGTAVFDDFQGSGWISGTGHALSMNGSGVNADANAVVASDVTAASLDLQGYTGTLNFGGRNGLFVTHYDNMDYTGTSVAGVDSTVNFTWGTGSPDAAIAADTWTSRWEGYVQPRYSETYTFFSRTDDGARLWVNGQLLVDKWVTQAATSDSGTIALTAGQKYSIVYEFFENTGGAEASLRWSSASQTKEIIPKRCLFAGRIAVTGNANMSTSATLTAGDGTLEFSGTTGTQVFTVRASQTHPIILKTGASTLQLLGNNLSTLGYFHSAGILDFNGYNLTTVAGGYNRGDLQVWNGTSTTFTGLAGRTLTIAGHASLVGQSGNLLNLNPATAWTLAVTGQLMADYVTVANCNASVTAGIATRSGSGAGNSGWAVYGHTFFWNRSVVFTGSTNFHRAYNWSYNADGTGWKPSTSKDDAFSSTTLGSAWTFRDVDNDETSGSYALSGGQLILSGRGGDMWGATNQFASLYRTDITGDYEDITVKVVSQTNTDLDARTGIVMANNLTNLGSGGYAYVYVSPGGGFKFAYDVAGVQGEIDASVSTGTTAYPCWLRLNRNVTAITAWYKTSLNGAWTQIGAAQTPLGTVSGTNSHFGLFLCAKNGTTTGAAVFDDFTTGNYFSATDVDLSFNGTGANADGNVTLYQSQTVQSVNFTGYTGTLNFNGSNTLTLSSGNATFVSGMGLTPSTGTLAFTAASGTQTFTPISGVTFPALTKSGAGTVTVATNALTAGALIVSAGIWDWGISTLSHSLPSISTAGSSTMNFGTNTVTVTTGNCDLSGLTTINTGTGSTLAFTATSGTQVFTPKAGGNTHPNITKSGTGTLQLATNNLTCRSFALTGGFLDFNGRDITTNLSGNFTLTNGTATTLVNLGGRILTVAGNASFTGQSGNLLNLNATAWTVAATGTLTASYANIANSNASGTTGVATNSTNGGGNTNWNFSTVDYSAWNFRTRIRFNTTNSGANVSGNVANFPLLVRLDGTNFDFNQALSTGNDIRFVDPDGSTLPHEIERWNPTQKKAELWVKVPQIDGNSDRDYITLYWGNNAATSVSSGKAVFDTSLGYEGVWHFAGGSFNDATANANTLGNNGTTQDTGLVGDGRFMTANNMNLTNNSTVNMTSAITVSTWVRATDWTGGNRRILQKSGADDQYRLLTEAGALKWHLPGLTTGTTLTTSNIPSRGDWHLLTATYDGATSRIFLDGAVLASQSASGSLATTTGNIDVGGKPGSVAATDRFSGWMDEVMLSSAALSSNHVKLAYETQRPRGMKAYSLDATDLTKWAYSTKLYVNTTASGANVRTDQADFPLLVRLTRAYFDFTQAKSDGSDLRFADSSGNLLSYEIERWDASAKAADVWVLIPSVKGNNDGQWFRMYWGNGSAISLSSGASVFLGSAGYVGVWHLSEDGSTTSGAYKDATGFKHDGTGVALTNASDVSAVVGTGSDFTATSNQGLTVANSTALNPAALTVEAWINTTTQGTNYRRIAGKPFTSAAAPWNQYDLELNDPGNKVIFSLTIGGTEAGYTSTSTIANGTWYHVAGTYDGTAQKVYFNGVMEASAARTGSINDYGQPLSIGKYYHGTGSNFDGKIDEVRVSNVARSADWMKLNYETMKTGSAVVRVGERSLDYTKSVQFTFNTTSTGANVAGNVANIPILVRLSSSNLDFTAVRDDGADLKFVDKDGSSIYHEVVEWDKGNKTGKVWVKVPQVDGNSTADFVTLYYGCATCTGSPYAVKDSVWSSHAAVFHLSAAETRAFDATKNAYHGDYQRAQPMVAGLTTALAPVFDGANDYVQTTVPTTAGTRTLSAWIYPRSSDDVTYIESVIDGDVGGQFGTGFGLDSGVFKVILDDQFWTTTTAVSLNTWQQVALKFNATNAVLYKNGVSAASLTYTQGPIASTTLRIGRSMANALYFDGTLNDVQVMDSYASDDWVKLSYENQKAGSTFLSSPVTTASFTSSKVYKFNTTASGADVAGDVYYYPLLIRLTGSAVIGACQANGPDIRFLDADGVTWLDYSIERWKSTSPETADVWVKIPKLDGNSAGDFITLFYNDLVNGSVPDGQCGTCVFDVNNGFNGVWHLNGITNLGDATTRGNTATHSNATNGAGVVGAGVTSITTSFLEFANGTVSDLNQEVTLTIWTKGDAALPTNHNTWNARDGANNRAMNIHLPNGDGIIYWDAGNSGASYDRISKTADSAGQYKGAWRHWAFTKNTRTGEMKIYWNGSLWHSGTGLTRLLNNLSGVVRLGSLEAGLNYPGLIDEFRISRVERSADWVKLDYQTQRTDASPLFNPNPTDFVSTRKIVFNTTRTGANVMGDVDNFPLLVRLTGAPVQNVQNTYNDIRFLDGNGKTWLNYHVERWDKTLDSAEVWVSIPRVDGNSDRDFITLYYDDVVNGAVANGECVSCVFATANNFAGVWHLNEIGNTIANGYVDATANGYHGTGANLDNTNQVPSIAARGQSLNAAADVENIAFGTAAGSAASQTISFWAIATNAANMVPVDKMANDASGVGWNFKFRSDNTLWYSLGSETAKTNITMASAYAAGTWVHVTGTFDAASTTARFYVNGALAGSNASISRSVNNTATTLRIGQPSVAATGERFVGRMDELQISSAARDSNWVRLTYETQRRTGSLFWNARPGPNNRATLTAADAGGSISLTWTTPVTDSANADSIGLWVRYSGPPDSVGAAGQTKVAVLPKADSAYTYPAAYPGTYYFALAIRNAGGQWSPFTRASTDTVAFGGTAYQPDTVYVDSALGNDANTCAQARNPATPKLSVESADDCDLNALDTLVIRVMPGTYGGAGNDRFDSNTKPVVVTSFDNRTRAVFNSNTGSVAYNAVTYYPTVLLYGGVHLRNVDVMAGVNNGVGVYTVDNEGTMTISGCRIYNNGATRHAYGIFLPGTANNYHVANNLIHQPATYGIWADKDNLFNIVHNTLIGDGAAGTRGIYMTLAAFAADMTFTNNILYNWDYGIHTVSSTAALGVISNNLFHLVTNGRELTGSTDANKVVQDPLFYSTTLADPNAFKLLPGSPALNAGTTSTASGGYARTTPDDFFGSVRPQGSAPDIGAYEGTGYTPNPAGAFDSLTNTVSGNTVIVKNSKWKLVWDMARGGGITGFYDMTGDTTANLVATSGLLFDTRIDAYLASTQTGNTLAPVFWEKTKARAVVRQRLALSASLDHNIWYTIYPSGHVYIQSEIANLSSAALAVGTVEYMLKVGTATAVTKSGSNLSGISYKNGYGYLTTATKDAFLSVTQDLDGAGWFTETWSQSGSIAGTTDSVGFSTANLADPAQNMKRHHHFLLYIGDGSLDNGKASTLNADAWNPSPVSVSSGSLIHERSWQDRLGGHWTFDEGAGTVVKDRSITYTNNSAAMTSCTWVSGKVGGALRFTTSSAVQVSDNDALEVRRHSAFMFWFKPDFAAMESNATIISKGTSTSDGWYFKRIIGGNQIRFRVDGATADTPELTTGVWYHLAGVVGGSGQLYLFVNGILVSASTSNAAMVANTSPLRFGENAGTNDKYAGDIDDVRIYHFGPGAGEIQAIVNRGFSFQSGHYHLRADNNNRLVALLNETTAQTRVQPAFRIDNWFGSKAPKYVYLNGTRLIPNVDFVADSIWNGSSTWDFGNSLMLQVNKVLTGTSQTLFVDDDDSTGYMGEAARMKTLAITATANDKIAIQNFSGSTFGSASSGQWYLELDLNGWANAANNRVTDTGFGEFNAWKSAAINPNMALTSATQLVGTHSQGGRTLATMKFHNTTDVLFSGGIGYGGPANISYTLVDSSATRLSLTLSSMTISATGKNAALTKRWTVYPTGRVVGSFVISTLDFNMDSPEVRLMTRLNSGVGSAYAAASATSSARWGALAGDLDFHSVAGGILSVRSAAATVTAPGSIMNTSSTLSGNTGGADFLANRLRMITTLFESVDVPITVNFAFDISKDFADSATADSLIKDLQTPATITALTGTATTNDALDFNADGFAEGDGAYTYTSSGTGITHFKFVNTVTHFQPAFRIKSWTFGTLPEYVLLDNQTLTKDYHYNAYLNTASNELILQFNRTLKPANHVVYIAHKTGLAVSLNRFEAVGGEGVDTLRWTTESEFENLGFHLWRRIAPVQDLPDSLFAGGARSAGTGIANALLENARAAAAAKAAADSAGADTLPSHSLSPEELKALGYVRITPKLIPGAKGGSSATTQEYTYIDRAAGFGITYEYLLEAVDFSGGRVQYGPRAARPQNPLETALYPNYPNPFNPVTTLRFSLKEKAKVSLTVYDAKGRVVRTLIRPDKPMLPGKYRLLWDARDNRGFEVPSGQYFYRFSAPKYIKTRKMILVK